MKPSTADHRTVALTLVGLAFLWPCLESFVTRRFRASLAFSDFAIPTEWGGVIVCASVLAATAAAGALYAARRLPGPRTARYVVVGLGTLSCLGNLVFAQASELGEAVTPLSIGALVVTGAFIVVAVLAWGRLLATLPVRHALFAVLFSNIASFGAQGLLDTLDGDVLLYVLVACPLATVLCWVACQPNRPAAWAPLGPSLRRLPWRTLLLAFALICFEGLFSPMLFSRHEGWPRSSLGMTLLLCAAICLILTVLVWRGRTVQGSLALGLPVLLVLYMAALLVTVVFPASPALVAERTMVAIGTGMRVYLWLLLTYECCVREAPPVPTFLVYCALVLSIPYSSAFSFSLEWRGQGASVSDLWGPGAFASLASVALFAVAVLAMAVSSKGGRDPRGADASHAGDLDAIAREANLSEREAQVLDLLARGFSAKVAAQKLGLAESTVVTHTTHIYRKLGINSRQELLQLVDNRGGSQPSRLG